MAHLIVKALLNGNFIHVGRVKESEWVNWETLNQTVMLTPWEVC
jgi:hypothetical protein